MKTITLKGKPINSLVLLKPKILNDKVIFNSGNFIYIDTSYNETEHTNIFCEVVAIPDKCTYKDGEGNIHEWPIEVKEGDLAYCYYLPIHNSLKRKFDGKSFIENGELYVLIEYYRNIFVVIRDEKVIPINDYILVSPLYQNISDTEERLQRSNMQVPESIKEEMRKNSQYGIIRNIGMNLSAKDGGFNDEELCVGRKILFRKGADIPLEHELHRTLTKDTIYRIRRTDVEMIFED